MTKISCSLSKNTNTDTTEQKHGDTFFSKSLGHNTIKTHLSEENYCK